MSTRYSSDYKSLVARLLWMYGGNVPLVSHLTAIPERTLRSWRSPANFPAAFGSKRLPNGRNLPC